MSEKVRFMEMTKPMKFRNIRKFLSWCKALRERILYLFNYILYKLFILKRYSYRDNVENHLGVLPYHNTITHPNLVAQVDVRVIENTYYNQDYFYRETKWGKKITYTVIDDVHTETHLIGVLEHIGIRIKGQSNYMFPDYMQMPVIRTQDISELKPFNPEAPLERPHYTEYRFDLNTIKNLRNMKVLNFKSEDLSAKEMKYFYEVIQSEFESHFRDFNINSIMVVRKV